MNELISALIKARSEFQPIRKDKVNSSHQNKYATLDAVLEAVEPALQKHGLAIVQTTEINDGQIVLKTTLYHVSGQSISGHYPLPQTDDSQRLGAAITYGRRYAVCGILSVTADEDDDGNAASASNSKPAVSNSRGTITKAEWEARKRATAQA